MSSQKRILSLMTNTGAFGLPWMVAHQEGFFAREGLDVHIAERDPIAPVRDLFARRKEQSFEAGEIGLYSVCEWGALQRIDRGSTGKVLYTISSASPFAIMTFDTHLQEPAELKDVPIGVKEFAGSHYATISLLEQRLPSSHIRINHVGGPLLRLQQLLSRQIQVVTLMEHYIQLAQSHGARILIQGNFSEVAFCRGHIDNEMKTRLLKTTQQAVNTINENGKLYQDLLLADVPVELKQGFFLKDIHYSIPTPYSKEKFSLCHKWMRQHGFLKSDLAWEDVV